MIKSFAIAAVMSGLLASTSFAQATPPASDAPAAGQAQALAPVVTPSPAAPSLATPSQATGAAPENPDHCLRAASDLAQSAEDHKLGEAQLDKIEDLLTKMETHCDARQFVEAMAVANDIKSLIETR